MANTSLHGMLWRQPPMPPSVLSPSSDRATSDAGVAPVIDSAQPHLEWRAYADHDPRLIMRERTALSAETTFGGARWRVVHADLGGGRRRLQVTLLAGDPPPCSLVFALPLPAWSRAHHLLMPGAVYAGNRFPSRPVPYSPRIPADWPGDDDTPLITDIPRLHAEPGTPGRIQQKAGDLAWPLAAVYAPESREWTALLTPRSHTELGETGFEFEENATQGAGVLRVLFPAVREDRYNHMRTGQSSPDKGACWTPGRAVVLDFEIHHGKAANAGALARALWPLRSRFRPAAAAPATLPFSTSVDLVAEHYDRDNWVDAPGFYLTTSNHASPHAWSAGWCGGFMNLLPLLASTREQTRVRARRALAFHLENSFAPCGLLWGKHTAEGAPRTDYYYDATPHTRSWTLIRRHGDVLYYAAPLLALLRRDASDQGLAEALARRMTGLADVLAAIWRRDGEWPQFVDNATGATAVRGSTSGAIIPGALARAAIALERTDWMDVARAGAAAYVRGALARGVTTGGPGDALQVPDSESCAGLVESFATLLELTRESEWREPLERAAALLATWVMPYDYPFAPHTEFGRLGLGTVGTVFANAQNKHSAPGLCTHAGAGLLRLFRATGDRRVIELARDIARSLPQFVSRPDRPVHDPSGHALPSGWINERVNTSDWDNNPGGVFHGSCWCEVSLLLTAHDLPGVYARPDLRDVWAFDHVEATWTAEGRLWLRNPTPFPARVSVLLEDAKRARAPLPLLLADICHVRTLAPGGAITLSLDTR